MVSPALANRAGLVFGNGDPVVGAPRLTAVSRLIGHAKSWRPCLCSRCRISSRPAAVAASCLCCTGITTSCVRIDDVDGERDIRGHLDLNRPIRLNGRIARISRMPWPCPRARMRNRRSCAPSAGDLDGFLNPDEAIGPLIKACLAGIRLGGNVGCCGIGHPPKIIGAADVQKPHPVGRHILRRSRRRRGIRDVGSSGFLACNITGSTIIMPGSALSTGPQGPGVEVVDPQRVLGGRLLNLGAGGVGGNCRTLVIENQAGRPELTTACGWCRHRADRPTQSGRPRRAFASG